MKERKKLEQLIARKEAEIKEKREILDGLARQIELIQATVDGLKEALSLLPQEVLQERKRRPEDLRAGSEVAKARDAIRAHGRPMRVNELVAVLGKEQTKKNRSSLAGSLSWYVRNGWIFTRPAPNTFGLTDLVDGGEKKYNKHEDGDKTPSDSLGNRARNNVGEVLEVA